MDKADYVPIGKITGAHGICGHVKIESYAESLSIFEAGRVLVAQNSKGEQKSLSIDWVKPHAKAVLLALKESGSRTEAEALVGCRLYIARDSLPALESGTHYWFDIIGLDVFTIAGEYLGRVTSILPTGSNDVYIVRKRTDGRRMETLVPAIASVVVSIDLVQKTLQVDLPEGL